MSFRILIFSLLLVFGRGAMAEESATETDTAKAVRLNDALEADPLRSDALPMRRWLLEWLINTPDYSVKVCTNLIGPLDKSSPHIGELSGQLMFGNVAYQIKNPDIKAELSLQVAGLESVLRSYTAILDKHPDAKIPLLDTLLIKQKDGLLVEYVESTVSKECPNTL